MGSSFPSNSYICPREDTDWFFWGYVLVPQQALNSLSRWTPNEFLRPPSQTSETTLYWAEPHGGLVRQQWTWRGLPKDPEEEVMKPQRAYKQASSRHPRTHPQVSPSSNVLLVTSIKSSRKGKYSFQKEASPNSPEGYPPLPLGTRPCMLLENYIFTHVTPTSGHR